MAANTNPIYTGTPDVQWGTGADGNGGTANTPLKTQNTALDGTGTVYTVFTADATNGGYVRSIMAKAAGTNIASVLRVFVNNGSASSTAANNSLIGEISLPATTAATAAATQNIEYPINFALPAGFKINVTLGTSVAAGWYPTA